MAGKHSQNRLPKTDIQDTHTGRDGGNQVETKGVLEQCKVALDGLSDGSTQVAEYRSEPMVHPTLGVMCVRHQVKLENLDKGRPHLELGSIMPVFASLFEGVTSGKLEQLGGTDLVISLPNAPRSDLYTLYIRPKH